MPTGVYKRKPKEKERLRLMIKEIGFRPEKDIRMSPRTEFKRGHIPWNKGIACSDKTKRKISFSHKAKGIEPKIKYIAYGEKHHGWKGGKTPLIMKIRNSKEYAEWRNKVFEKDNYTCLLCNDNKGGNLNAHHIEPLSAIIHNNNINNFEEALNCFLIWDIKNGTTICETCHPVADEVGRIRTIICN